ncbi:hypothetical protein NQ314_009013 [Rhamnusium bicolor]|uniref:HAT C-terminal dimerisation domain-containing protein n=1 Tax=Rhamnusium bicolor TaxID=1586634 RepID=A0AAV8Y4R0_9CUCU|nr:hypothetical protein NQ314_009013 [Rhamnusium bicolor]
MQGLSIMGLPFLDYSVTNKVPNDIMYGIQTRCKNFLSTLAKELAERIPNNVNVVNAVKNFCPERCLTMHNRAKFSELSLNLLKTDKVITELQWKELINVRWEEELGKENFSSEEFWITVYNSNAGGEFVFRNIASFALDVLSLPLSNAVVERVFSIMNGTKNEV